MTVRLSSIPYLKKHRPLLVFPPLQTMLPLEEMHRAGAISTPGIGADLNAPPKAGVGIPESREGLTTDASNSSPWLAVQSPSSGSSIRRFATSARMPQSKDFHPAFIRDSVIQERTDWFQKHSSEVFDSVVLNSGSQVRVRSDK